MFKPCPCEITRTWDIVPQPDGTSPIKIWADRNKCPDDCPVKLQSDWTTEEPTEPGHYWAVLRGEVVMIEAKPANPNPYGIKIHFKTDKYMRYDEKFTAWLKILKPEVPKERRGDG